ncbi:hypothetical protein KJ953_02845 [Patescibacteria group bacterium]|nr:hypothetical protein [Patescibacteria group bacterium]MBU1256078.1 hypothetical protein [Patescibacteria group bacterium]MBU1457620.1 hypothetical protein [Patescibacteria group bacterium]
MIKHKKTFSPHLILAIILVISFFLRFYRLGINIPSLYSDDLGHLQMLFSIQGQITILGLFSKFLHLLFTFTWALGPTVLGIRFATALYGSLIPLFMFFFVKAVNRKNIQVALVSSALSTVLPWSFMISRGAYTHIPLIIILTLVHLTLFIKAKKITQYLVSLIPLLLAANYYPSMIVITPLVIPFYAHHLYRKTKTKKQKQAILITTMMLAFTIIAIFFTRYNGFTKQSRGVSLVITNDVNVTAETNLYRGYSQKTSPSIFSFGLPTETVANKLLYNFPAAVVRQFTENYLSFFSPDFLFLKGDSVLRHSTGQFGVFFPVLLPFMVYGAFIFFNKTKKKHKQLLLLWIIISPIPAAITNDGAKYLLRVVTLLPLLTYFSALGITKYISLFKAKTKTIISTVVFSAILFSAYGFFFGYFHVYPTLSAQSYEYGFRELSDFQVENNNQPLLVLWEGPYPNSYFRFYQQTKLSEYFGFNTKEIIIGNSLFYQTFDNLYFSWPKSKQDLDSFLTQYQVPHIAFPKTYLLNNPQYTPAFSLPPELILFPDLSTAFTIYKL